MITDTSLPKGIITIQTTTGQHVLPPHIVPSPDATDQVLREDSTVSKEVNIGSQSRRVRITSMRVNWHFPHEASRN